MSMAVKAGTAKPGLQRLGQVRAPSGHFVPESHLNELARMLDSTSAVSGFRVRRIGINDSVWLVTCPANPEGWMIKKVPARRRYSGVPTDVENCDALIRKFPGIVEDQRLAFPHSVVAIHSLSAPWSSQAGDHVADLLVSRRAPGDQLGVYLAELDLTKSQDQTTLEEVCAGVGEMLADFHARYADPVTGEATYHTDFHPSNVLYEKKTGTLSIVDLTGMGNPGSGDDVQKFERLIFGMAGERYALAFRHRYLAMAKTSVCKTDRSSSKSTVASSTDVLWAVPSFHLPAPPTRTGSFKSLSSLAVPESGFNPDKHLTTLAFMLSPTRVCEPQLIPLSSRAKAWVLRQGSANECWVIQQASPVFAERCEEFVRQCPSVLEDAQLAFPHSAIPLQANQKQVGSLLVAECSFRTTLEQYVATLDQTTNEDQAKLRKVLSKIGETLSAVLARYAIFGTESDEDSPRVRLQLRPGNVLYDPTSEAIAFADFSWPGDANAVTALDRLYDTVKSLAGPMAAEAFQEGYQNAQRSRHRPSVADIFQYGSAFCQPDPVSEVEAASSGSESEEEQREQKASEQCSLM